MLGLLSAVAGRTVVRANKQSVPPLSGVLRQVKSVTPIPSRSKQIGVVSLEIT
jgi:hypothetical protein